MSNEPQPLYPSHHDDPRNPRPFSDRVRYQLRHMLDAVGKWGATHHLNPDVISLIGLAVVMIAALVTAQGYFFAAALILIIGAPLDALDGAIARAMGRKNRFGALLDSTLDRYADGFMFVALAYWFARQGEWGWMMLAQVALIGAFVVSYVRARAEGLAIASIRDGLFDRFVRVVILIGMLLSGWVTVGLVILAIGNHFTALQRIWMVYQLTRQDETP